MSAHRGGAELRGFLALGVGLILMGCGPDEGTGPVVVCGPFPSASVGVPFSLRLEARGVSGAVTAWRIVDDTLPPGLGLSPVSGCPVRAPFQHVGSMDATLGHGRLSEVSGMAVSHLNPGVLWVIDDGGNPSDLYALDRQGSLRQRYHLDTPNTDWEDLAIGPGPEVGREYLYIADVGDNGGRRSNVRLIRVREPVVPAHPGAALPLAHEAFHFAWPDGARDCEALLLDWATATPYLIEKRRGGANVYKFPMPLDSQRTSANPVQLLPVTGDSPLAGHITAGDASRDGRGVAVRSYGLKGQEYRRPPGGRFDEIFQATPCPISFSLIQQYEALAYGLDGLTLLTTTENAVFETAPLLQGPAHPAGPAVLLAGVPAAAGLWRLKIELHTDTGETVPYTLELRVR